MAEKVRDYPKLAQDIINVIGPENIVTATHCATRLRLVLKETPPDANKRISTMPAVISVVESGGQFQVVIGTHAKDVYAEVAKILKLDENSGGASGGAKTGIVNAVIAAMSGCMAPFVYILAACGLLQGVLILATMAFPAFASTGTYEVLSFISWTPFTYMPVFIAVAGSKHFKVNTYIALLCCCCLVNTSWTEMAARISSGEVIKFLFFNLSEATYTSTMLPPVIVLVCLVYVERFWTKVCPEVVQPIFVPLLSTLVMVPATLCILGPITTAIANGLAAGYQMLYNAAAPVAAAIVGFFWQCLVIFGVHWSFTPLAQSELNTVGYSVFQPFCGIAVCAQTLACFAVYLKSKNANMKTTSLSSGLTGIFGITEPAIYGVTLRLKKPFFCACAGSAVGSVICALMGGKYYTYAGLTGFLSIPNAASTTDSSAIIAVIIGSVVASIISFALVMVVGFEDIPEETEEEVEVVRVPAKPVEIFAPIAGTAKPLSECTDEVFSSGAMGEGVCIDPTEGKVFAPCDGKVENLFDTLHAIGISSDDGAELLIHVGMDTVGLGGQGFKAHCRTGDTIAKGDLLLEFDMDLIKSRGLSTITPVVVTNADAYATVRAQPGVVKPGDRILTLSEIAETSAALESEIICSPISGEVQPLENCPDKLFASGDMGQGFVLEPSEGKVYAPCDGTVKDLFESLHALGLTSSNGAEILLHIGMDTFDLHGHGFTAHCKTGDKVKKGDLILEFDIPSIKAKNLPVTTPVIVTNGGDYGLMMLKKMGQVRHGEEVLDLKV